MRLTEAEIVQIRTIFTKEDPLCRVFLFGSRSNDQKKGGDLDLLVESTLLTIGHKRTLLVALKHSLGDQKIDLLFTTSLSTETNPFIQSIKPELVQL